MGEKAVVLQKLMMPWLSDGIAAQGLDSVGGPVVAAADAASLRTPAQLVEAFGLVGEGRPFGADSSAVPYVDVLRFETTPLMRLSKPAPDLRGGWAAYASGFLPTGGSGDGVVPVWILDRTRVPTGTEFWRIAADGRQQALSVYAGPAEGWRGGRGYLPPYQLVGPRVEWRGLELPAGLGPEPGTAELVAVGQGGPEGFDEVRPGIWRRFVPLAECTRVFELRLTCTWRGAPCRILQVGRDEVLLQLLGDEPAEAARLGAGEAEPGVYEVTAPKAELEDQVGTTVELADLDSA